MYEIPNTFDLDADIFLEVILEIHTEKNKFNTPCAYGTVEQFLATELNCTKFTNLSGNPLATPTEDQQIHGCETTFFMHGVCVHRLARNCAKKYMLSEVYTFHRISRWW